MRSFLGHRLVHGDHADLVVELVDDRDLPGRRLDDLERIGVGEHARQPVGHAEFAGVVDDRAVLQARHVLLIGGLARRGERQFAAADELDFGVVFGRPIDPGKIRRRPCRPRRTAPLPRAGPSLRGRRENAREGIPSSSSQSFLQVVVVAANPDEMASPIDTTSTPPYGRKSPAPISRGRDKGARPSGSPALGVVAADRDDGGVGDLPRGRGAAEIGRVQRRYRR